MEIGSYHASKLSSWHLDDASIVSLRDSKMLLIKVHQLHLIVRDLLLVGRLEHEGDVVSLVLGFHGDDVIVGCTSEQKIVFSQKIII